jgi:hypothetical protein
MKASIAENLFFLKKKDDPEDPFLLEKKIL